MIPERLLPISALWVRPALGEDDYGNTVPDWDAPSVSGVRVMVEQRRTVEEQGGRDVTTTTLVLFTNELAVDAGDRFVWDGRTYEVDGDPAVVYSPAGPHHAECALRLVVG